MSATHDAPRVPRTLGAWGPQPPAGNYHLRQRRLAEGPSPSGSGATKQAVVAGGTVGSSSRLKDSVRLGLPAQHAPGLGQVMFLLVLVAGDIHRVEATVAGLHRLQRSQIGARQILLIGHIQPMLSRGCGWRAPLFQP